MATMKRPAPLVSLLAWCLLSTAAVAESGGELERIAPSFRARSNRNED
jgi:hypothetical protein